MSTWLKGERKAETSLSEIHFLKKGLHVDSIYSYDGRNVEVEFQLTFNQMLVMLLWNAVKA